MQGSQKINEILTCAVCYEMLDQTSQCLDPCGHTFHKICIEKLFKSECPTCKQSIKNTIQNWTLSHLAEELFPEKKTARKISQALENTNSPTPKNLQKPIKAPTPLPWALLPDLSKITPKSSPHLDTYLASTSSVVNSQIPSGLIDQLNDLTSYEYVFCAKICDIPEEIYNSIRDYPGYEIREILLYLEKNHKLPLFKKFLNYIHQDNCLQEIENSCVASLFSENPNEEFIKSPLPEPIGKAADHKNVLHFHTELIFSLDLLLKPFGERIFYQCGMPTLVLKRNFNVHHILKKLYALKDERGLETFLDVVKKAYYIPLQIKINCLNYLYQSPCWGLFYPFKQSFDHNRAIENIPTYFETQLVFQLEQLLNKASCAQLRLFYDRCQCSKAQIAKFEKRGAFLFFIHTYQKKGIAGLNMAYVNFISQVDILKSLREEYELTILQSPCRDLFIEQDG